MGMTSPACCFISALLLTFSFVVQAQTQLGFISIDCGMPANYSSKKSEEISYTSDFGYIDTGENHQISLSNVTEDPKLKDLRSFPEGKRNCYTLSVTEESHYLVRAYFLYGNYDGMDTPPQFDLYLGTNLWSNVSISNASSAEVREIIAAAEGNTMQVCLVKTGSGKPFISALELRPFIVSDRYPVNSTQSLITVATINFGDGEDKIRYSYDNYDRIWTPYLPPGSTPLDSGYAITKDFAEIPSAVMDTAVTPITGSTLNFSWPVDESRGPLYYYILQHFAELESLNKNESRKFNTSLNGVELATDYEPLYLEADWWDFGPELYSKLEFSLSGTDDSSLPPLINAMEIFEVRSMEESSTNIIDVESMRKIKIAFGFGRNWMGDPCAPKDFLWAGLGCNYDVKPYRITRLDLSHSGLVGNLPASLGDLSELQYLDLSSNNLSGDIPAFLAKLPNIGFLNITCSGLKGTVPKEIQDLVDANRLNLVAGPCLPASDLPASDLQALEPHSRTNKAVKIAVVGVGSVFLLLLVVGIIFWWKRHHKQSSVEQRLPAGANTNVTMSQYQSDCRLFQYEELVRMTNNFSHLLGMGGSCSVFLGHLDNGTPVAVKKLLISVSSSKQFKDEVEVLKTINHRNLITLIGYCKDKGNLALVHEYMPRGSLGDQLSGQKDGKETLSWRDRVRIAFEASQGLEYLHYGCRKPVIHRDVKPTNILLTTDNGAMIADFGISKTMPTRGRDLQATRIVGTPGYVDPEYVHTGTPTEKSDVYSFGVILLQLITGLPAIVMEENWNLVSWVQTNSQSADLDKMVDRRLQGYNQDSIWAIMELALNCTRAVSLHRPTMTQVVAQLKDCLELVDAYKGSGLSTPSSAARIDGVSSEVLPMMTLDGATNTPSPR